MKNNFLLIIFLFIASIAIGDAVFIQGNNLRGLRQNFDLNGVVTIQSGASQPNVTPVSGNEGSIYLSTGGSTYVKQDAGLTSNWSLLTSGGLTALLAGNGITVSGSTVSLKTPVTIQNGGTSTSSLLIGNRLIVSSGNTIGEMNFNGTAGQILTSNGIGLPTFQTSSLATPITIQNGGTSTNVLLNNNRMVVTSGNSIHEMNFSGTVGQILTSTGPSSLPTFQTSSLATPITIQNGGTSTSTLLNNNRFMISKNNAIVEQTALLGSSVVVTDVNGLPTVGAATMGGSLNMGLFRINSLTDPAVAQDAATKNYVDAVGSGLNPLQAVYAGSSTTNFSANYLNGVAGVGATLTATANGAFAIDNVSPPINSRILFKDQSSGFQNGVYNLTVVGTGITPAILTRSLDYNTAGDMNAGDLIPIENGTTNVKTTWLQTATITTVGTDSLVFTQWTQNPSNYLQKSNNLSDVTNTTTSFNNISPMIALGDLIYGGTSGAGSRLAIGSAQSVLSINNGLPYWQGPGSSVGVLVSAHVPSTSASWQQASASATLGAFASNGSIGNNVIENITSQWGSPQTSNSNLPQITINNLVPGTYKVTAILTAQATSSSFTYFAINDGTNTYGSVAGQPGNSGTPWTISAIFVYTTTANRTFAIWGANNTAKAQIGTGSADSSNFINWIIEKVN